MRGHPPIGALSKNLVALATLVASTAIAWPALAQSTSAQDREAQALFEAGRVAYQESRFETALARFEESYALSHRPALLYNVGQCQDRLRQDEAAIATFERYLELVPDAANRAEVEGRLTALRAAVARAREDGEDAADPDPPPVVAPPPPPDTTEVYEEWWFWTLIGVGVAAAVVVPIVVTTTPAPIDGGDFGTNGVITALEVSF